MKKAVFGLFLLFFLGFGQVAKAQDTISISSWTEIPVTQFEPQKGDYFVTDLKNSIGYLIRKEIKGEERGRAQSASARTSEGASEIKDDRAEDELSKKESKTYTSFPILSGQQRNVYYLGRYYYAATPEKTWEVKLVDIQSDRVTYSKSGKFLRLLDNGKRTSYGIHGHKYFDVMNGRENKFVSFGCVLVADNVLEILEKLFELNENSLKVVTTSDPSLLSF